MMDKVGEKLIKKYYLLFFKSYIMKNKLFITISIVIILLYLIIRLIKSQSDTDPCKNKIFLENNKCVSSCSEKNPYISGNNCVNSCPIDKPFYNNNYCSSSCPRDKPFKKNNECVSSCLPGISVFNECTTGECPTKYTDTITGECTDVIPEGKFALGNNIIQRCPNNFYNELRECDTIGNFMWNSLAVSSDGKYIYASYKNTETGKYDMYIINDKKWSKNPTIKDEEYIDNIKVSNNIVIYKSTNNLDENTYKISLDNGSTFNLLNIDNETIFKDVEISYDNKYIIAISALPLLQISSNDIIKYNILSSEINRYSSRNLIYHLVNNIINKNNALIDKWFNNKDNTHEWALSLYRDSYINAIANSELVSKSSVVKCKIGVVNNNYKFLIATKNFIFISDENGNFEKILSFGPKDYRQYIYDRFSWIYNFILNDYGNKNVNLRNFLGYYPTRNGFSSSIQAEIPETDNFGIAFGFIEDIQTSNDFSKIYVVHNFNSHIYFNLFTECANTNSNNFCNRDSIALSNINNYLVNSINSNFYQNKIKKYISLIEPIDSGGNYKDNTLTYNHIYTETIEKIKVSTNLQGDNIAAISTSISPLVSINKVGYNLNFNPYKEWKLNFEKFNNINISKSSSNSIDGKYIIASVNLGPLYYSEDFGISWIKI